jgi:predicted oxidoreductase (fatty acid repression mutant protein)
MANAYFDLIKQRRTYYSLQHQSPISDSRIIEIARTVLLHTPSSLNCQSTRYVVLLGEEHIKFWSIVKDCLKGVAAPSDYANDQIKLDGRQEGYGTVSDPTAESPEHWARSDFLVHRRFSFTKIAVWSMN